ncbi:MAG: gluconolactonase [Sphingomonadales bacterium]|nr:gluconolactonase [Sphingomonadales bacterium]MDE2171585.1 gluconolactonase [Sphingomonadales bacterium]
MPSPLRALLAATSALLGILAGPLAIAAPAAPAFSKLPSIQAPDDLWDFASWDEAHHRLLVAHGKDVLLVNPATRDVRSIGQIAYAHAVVPLPGQTRILVTSKLDNTVRILDADRGAELVRIPVAQDPDATVLSANGHTAYVMAAKAGVISVIDLDRMVETRRIPLKTGLEVAVLATPSLLAVNTEDFNEIELVDLVDNKHVGAIPLPGCEGPTGLAMGPGTLALSACANGKAALVDIAHRKVVRLLPIDQDPDTAIWDAAHHRFLVPCGGNGRLSIISLDKSGPHVRPSVETGPEARTAALDPATGRLYLPSARLNPVIKGQPRTVQPASFRIIALSPR